jgi:hypothetical protein
VEVKAHWAPISSTRQRRSWRRLTVLPESPRSAALQNAFGLGALRLRCSPARLDHGPCDLKIATCFGGRAAGRTRPDAAEDVGYRRHMDALRLRLAQALAETCARLEAIGIAPWIEPGPAGSCGAICPTASMRPRWPSAP